MPKPNKEIKQLLINDFGYEPVELESYTGQLRALKEFQFTSNKRS